ncbi:phosphoglycolate phosphatase [Gallibacterium trehalosifermentans]|uniref:Phosphoglycolate phosphatase n=1 Tax=Gallibacterium trehalosifermentans TaxID=516935 RepID=A0ABV6H2P3_9PAST
MSQFKAIGFDLDGTLVNSLPDLTLAISNTFKEFNLPNPHEELVLTWIGNGADILLARALEWAGTTPSADTLKQMKIRFNFHYGENICHKSELYPHVKQTLLTLKEQGFTLAVVTNKPTQHVLPVLKAFEIDHLFTETLGGQSLPAIKPHPAPLFYLCGRFGILPQELLFVGDSKNDILAARAAGCAVVGLTYGYNYNEPIAESKPDWVFSDFAKLLTIV